MLNYIALGMVLDKPLTGYDIKKEIEAGVGNFYTASYGSLYPILKKLTDNGYVTMFQQQQGGRTKKYYQATAPGREAFLTWLAAPLDPSLREDSHLASIYFFDELPEDVRQRQLSEYELYYQQKLRKLLAMEKRLSQVALVDEYHEMSTLYLGIQRIQDIVRWLKFVRERKPLAAFVRNDTLNT